MRAAGPLEDERVHFETMAREHGEQSSNLEDASWDRERVNLGLIGLIGWLISRTAVRYDYQQ